MSHLGIAHVDLVVGNLDLVAPPDLYLQLLVDEVFDDFVAHRRLAGGKLDEFHPLLDVVVRDDVAVDDQHHLLGAREVRCRHRRQQAAEGNRCAKDSSFHVPPVFHRAFTSAEFAGRKPPTNFIHPFGRPGKTGSGRYRLPPPRVRRLNCIITVWLAADVAAIGVVGVIVERQDEAVVDIAEAEPRLVELAGREIVAGAAVYHPILADLEGLRGEDAFAPVQESELGLCGIVADT